MTEIKDREGQVTLQMGNLNNKLAELEKYIAEMKIRLGSVLISDIEVNEVNMEVNEGRDKIKSEHLVHLANDIRSYANQVDLLSVKVKDLLQALEL